MIDQFVINSENKSFSDLPVETNCAASNCSMRFKTVSALGEPLVGVADSFRRNGFQIIAPRHRQSLEAKHPNDWCKTQEKGPSDCGLTVFPD